MTIEGTRYAKRTDVGQRLHRRLTAAARGLTAAQGETLQAMLGGLEVQAGVDRRFREVWIESAHGGIELRYALDEWPSVDPLSLVQRLERRIQNLDSSLTDARGDKAAAEREAGLARARLGTPFEHDSELCRLQRRQRELDHELTNTDGTQLGDPLPADRMAARLASSSATATTRPALSR